MGFGMFLLKEGSVALVLVVPGIDLSFSKLGNGAVKCGGGRVGSVCEDATTRNCNVTETRFI